jgi:hypothetical protein
MIRGWKIFLSIFLPAQKSFAWQLGYRTPLMRTARLKNFLTKTLNYSAPLPATSVNCTP